MRAYDDLSTEKPLGFGAEGRVPWSSIIAYAQFNRLDRVSTRLLVTIVRALDSVYMKWSKTESDRKNKTSNKK